MKTKNSNKIMPRLNTLLVLNNMRASKMRQSDLARKMKVTRQAVFEMLFVNRSYLSARKVARVFKAEPKEFVVYEKK